MGSVSGTVYLSSKGYGSTLATCTGLSYGFEVLGEESESRMSSTFYPHQVSESDFTITMAFNSYAKWKTFNEWMEKYSRKISTPGNGIGSLVVEVPSHKFLRVGIPYSGFQYGDKVGDVVRTLSLKFKTVTDLTGGTSEPEKSNDPDVQFFYPSYIQLSAKDRTENSLYDAPEVPADNTATVVQGKGKVI